jgi:hypothetical protein
MAKKTTAAEMVATDVLGDSVPEEGPFDDMDSGAPEEIDGDFNIEEEFKPEPLVPTGKYTANITKVTWSNEKKCLTWELTLDGNSGFMSDGETEIDGARLYCRNYFPKPGDEEEMSASGRTTKRQSKINMAKRFAEDMKIKFGTAHDIAENIAEGNWIGIRVAADVGISEYMGQVRNEVGKMSAISEY